MSGKVIKRRRGSIIEIKGAKGVSYKLKFDAPTVDGSRNTQYKTVRGTRKEAERELARLLGEAGRGVDLTSGKQPLATWIDTWLQDYAKGKVEQMTFERYTESLHRYIVPNLGTKPLAMLTTMQIQKVYSTLYDKPLAERTVIGIHRVLSACLKKAVGLKMITDNPCDHVELRRVKRAANGEDSMHVLPLDQLCMLFEAAKEAETPSAPYEMLLLAFDSGARRGEFLATRWSDIDFDKRTMRICRAVEETEAHGVRIKNTLKNAHSKRTVTLSAMTVAALRDLWRRRAELFLSLGERMPPDGLVFFRGIDPTMPLHPRAVSNAFQRLTKSVGLDGFRLHDLRHCCASHMLRANRPIPEVARHLGHSSPMVTMTTYAHAIPCSEGGKGLLDMIASAAE